MYYGNTKRPSMHFNLLGLGSANLLQMAFVGESEQNFHWETFPLGQQSVHNTKYKYKHFVPLFAFLGREVF